MRNISRGATLAAALTLALAACAPTTSSTADPEPPAASGNTAAEQPTAQGKCSDRMIASFDYNGPNNEVDISVIESAFGVDLPDGAGCVVLEPGDSKGKAFFHIFWPGQDQNFANTIGNTLVAAGVAAYGDPIEYRKGGADIELWAYPAGDDMHWSDNFDGSPELVIAEGNIPDTGYFG